MSGEENSDQIKDDLNRLACTDLMRAIRLHAEVSSMIEDLEKALEADVAVPFVDTANMLDLYEETIKVYEACIRDAAIHLEVEFGREDISDLAHDIFTDDDFDGDRPEQVERLSDKLYEALKNKVAPRPVEAEGSEGAEG